MIREDEETFIQPMSGVIPGHVPRGEREEEDGGGDPQAPTESLETRLARVEEQYKAERRSRKEAERRAEDYRFALENQPNGRATRQEENEEEEEEEVNLSVDLTDAITRNDAKAVRQALKELGYVSSKDVSSMVEGAVSSARQQIAFEAKLYKEYPDLEDPKSELSKGTLRHYKELSADPALKASSKTIEIAARLAQQEIDLEAGGSRRRSSTRPTADALEVDDDELDSEPRSRRRDRDEGDEDEYSRRERVRTQQGSRGRSRGADEPSDELSSIQRTIVERFRAAGAPIDEKKYRDRAKRGVTMSGLPGGRR